MNYRYLIVTCLITLSFALGIKAEVKLPAFFSDGMVMQQQTTANLWGTATPNKNVQVITGWDKKEYTVKADNSGNWKVAVATPGAGGPYQISFNDGELTVLNNILIGELWFCAGQSNMEMPMKGYKNQLVEGANMDILKSSNSNLRLFTVKRHSTVEPQIDVEGKWFEASPTSVREFSATAYYFGRLINEMLNVPVGLIVSAWGGSAAEAWMDEDMLKAFPEVKIPRTPEDIKSKNRTPTVLYNGMVHPLIGIAMRGVIWYQGEDNCDRYQTYTAMLNTLITSWRNQWGQGEFPFYYCQVAPYDYDLITEPGTINLAYIREALANVEHVTPNTGMAVLMDVGMEKCIHPANKKAPGERLALLALNNTYGVEGIASRSPYYKDLEIQNDTAIVSFERAEMWISAPGFESQLFEIAGEDKVFYPAKAWISRSKVHVKSENVKKPVAVRYGFKNYVKGDLFGDGELPVSSFRTDDW